MSSIKINRDSIEFGALLFKKKVYLAQIKEVKVFRLTSLIDEVGIVIYSENEKPVTFADSDSGFWKIAEKLNLDNILGKNWHEKTEKGKCFNISQSELNTSQLEK